MNVRVEISEDELSDLVKKYIKAQFPNNKLVADAVDFQSKVAVKPAEPAPDTKPEEPAEEVKVEAAQEKPAEFTWEPVSCRAVCELTTQEKKAE